MLGKQIKVYLHPKDRAAVRDYVRGDLASVLLAERWESSVPLELPSSEDPGNALLICPRELVDSLSARYVAAKDQWVVDPVSAPVIEWWHSALVDGMLYPGRFYYVPTVQGESAHSGKDERFLAVAGHLFRWVR